MTIRMGLGLKWFEGTLKAVLVVTLVVGFCFLILALAYIAF